MSEKILVPNIGDFHDVEVIEVYVQPGDKVAAEAPLIALESDKATMDIPSPREGVVEELAIKAGDKVSEGSLILTMAAASGAKAAAKESPAPEDKKAAPSGNAAQQTSTTPSAAASGADYDVAVIGGGPGGYAAAFRAADLGMKVLLAERYETLGGVCLNVGCIPSKALLHAAKVITEARAAAEYGVDFGKPKLNVEKMRGWKEGVVKKLTGGLAGLAKKRKVTVAQAVAAFSSANTLRLEGKDGGEVSFRHAIIAAGSEAVRLPHLPDDPRIVTSTGALRLDNIPKQMLVAGGGIIGLEMACVYSALGSAVSVVELSPQLMPGADADLVRVFAKRAQARFAAVHTGASLAEVTAGKKSLSAVIERDGQRQKMEADMILMAVGRRPAAGSLNLSAAGLQANARGHIEVDSAMRTSAPHIFAVGDIVGEPMLAHKAAHEGKVAAEAAAGLPAAFDACAIPSVAYTDPEVAWAGMTEAEARAAKRDIQVAVFPWAASGRALALGAGDGMTKLIIDKESGKVIGAGAVGDNAGELIAETVLAMELGADAEDIGLSVHPHPTLSETIGLAAEVASGTVTDIIAPRR